jgi:hypothetical protein
LHVPVSAPSALSHGAQATQRCCCWWVIGEAMEEVRRGLALSGKHTRTHIRGRPTYLLCEDTAPHRSDSAMPTRAAWLCFPACVGRRMMMTKE